jgi:hypothetical protein
LEDTLQRWELALVIYGFHVDREGLQCRDMTKAFFGDNRGSGELESC